MHQSAFLSTLAKEHEVILIVENELTPSLEATGWNIPRIDGIKLYTAPNDQQIEATLKKYDTAWHCISGLDAYVLGRKVMILAKQLDLENIIIITESFNVRGLKGILRKLKYKWLSIRYKKVVKAIFVTGLAARDCFENLNFKANIIFDWGYFTASIGNLHIQPKTLPIPSLLFVGSIDHRKNILGIIPTVNKYNQLFHKFYIVGKGPLVADLEDLIKNKDSIDYLGVLENSEIQLLMKTCDLLILPSIFDGWGAVVNEALSNGMRVLCSENCGSSVLLDKEMRGSSFNNKDNNFESHLLQWLNKGKVTQSQREEIIYWAKNHISGKVAAAYFIECIAFLSKQQPTKPKAPWL